MTMTAEKLVGVLRREVLESNSLAQKKMLSMDVKVIRDPVWKEIATATQSMTDQQQRAVELLIVQVAKDTLSNVLGILDGVSLVEEFRGNFGLTYESGKPLNGDLQDLFLSTKR